MINAEGMDSRITILIVIKDQTIRGLVFLSPNQPSIGVHLVNSMGLVAARAALADQAYLQLNSRPAAHQDPPERPSDLPPSAARGLVALPPEPGVDLLDLEVVVDPLLQMNHPLRAGSPQHRLTVDPVDPEPAFMG